MRWIGGPAGHELRLSSSGCRVKRNSVKNAMLERRGHDNTERFKVSSLKLQELIAQWASCSTCCLSILRRSVCHSSFQTRAGAQALRDQRHDAAGNIDRGFDVASVCEVARDVNAANVRFKRFRVVDRNFD